MYQEMPYVGLLASFSIFPLKSFKASKIPQSIMTVFLLISLILFWLSILLILFFWKRELLVRTWLEPYFVESPVLIESDDWGPGGEFHAERLQALLDALAFHKDSTKRSAVLTANVVLSVPDVPQIVGAGILSRKMLDRDFGGIHKTMLQGIANGTFVPQLHGLEHLNAEAFVDLCRTSDPRTESARSDTNWWDWEALDSPLQGHYVDGSRLPSRPISREKADQIVTMATDLFTGMFGCPSLTAVAPCYLWNDDIEQSWARHSIKGIQTAGYRCNARDRDGNYVQDKVLIRAGDKNEREQVYLVRNIMFEPVDGKNTPDTAYAEALQAKRQALPLTISTHRYNFTRSAREFTDSLAGLDELLNQLTQNIPDLRFLSSAELAECLLHPESPISNRFNNESFPALKRLDGIEKVGPFLYRLYYRHPKLAKLSYLTGLVIPGWLICKAANRKR